MRRTLATAGTALLISVAVTGCGGDDEGAKAGSKASSSSSSSSSSSPSSSPSAFPTELPSDLPTSLPTGIPTDLPTGLPTELPTAVPSQVSGGALDGCAVLTPALITADLGATSSGQGLNQASSFGDPNAKDCYYIGGDATVVVQATTRADADMPASSNSYEGLPGAEPVPGADRGWVFATSVQGSTTAGLILVKGQNGINCSIITQDRTVSVQALQQLAQHVLASL